MLVLGVLPGAALLLTAAVLFGRGREWRDALLEAAAVAVAWTVLGTELLGAVGALRFWPVLAWWAGGAALAALALARRPPVVAWRPARPGLAALLLAAAAGWTLCQALLAPPNTADALGYHLPRQVYWEQQGHVGHFATSVLRQVAMPPLAEFAGLHLRLLSGGDRFANLVQWAAWLGALLAVSRLAAGLGATRRGQWLAVAVAATTPSAFVQASSAKNDVVVAFWLCAATVWTLRLRSGGPWTALKAGTALGALALTKGTGLVFGLPVGLLAGALALRGPASARKLLLLAAPVLLLNAGHVARNVAAFGSPFGPDAAAHGVALRNEAVTPTALASNLARNAALELALPWAAWNEGLARANRALHAQLGLAIDAPATTVRPYADPGWWPASEDTATAPGQMLIALLLPLALLGGRRAPRGLAPWGLAAAGFVVFAAALKWQPWQARLLFPLAFPVAASVGALFPAGLPRRFAAPLAAGLIALLLPSANTLQRPLLGPASIALRDRDAVLLYGTGAQGRALREVARVARGLQPARVGFWNTFDGRDYAFMTLLRGAAAGRDPVFQEFAPSFSPPGATPPPPDVVITHRESGALLVDPASGARYTLVGRAAPFSLFRRDTLSAARESAAPPGPASAPSPASAAATR
ncbi:MAG: hypothetical protein KJ067_13955 [Vicinamibacteria bacterium]|nr:hypothetical protein [Vicinamibacteria bacterium]